MNQLVVASHESALLQQHNIIAHMGQAANQSAKTAVFADYLAVKSENTLRNQAAALGLFAEYLADQADRVGAWLGIDAYSLQHDAAAWHGLTYGLVEGFSRWLLRQGHSIASVNNRLSAVKIYAGLAYKAGVIDLENHALIKMVKGIAGQAAQRIDEKRDIKRLPETSYQYEGKNGIRTVTRPCTKKSRNTPLTIRQVEDLLSSLDLASSQGLRDSLMIRLMTHYSLRVSEVAALAFSGEAYDKASDSHQPLFFDIESGLFSVNRIKTSKVQVKRLDAEDLEIARAYVAARPDCDHDFVFVGSRKGGRLRCEPMSISAINQRVRELGKEVLGVDALSPHDFRHYWATNATGDIDKLKAAGGWSSYTMLNRYRHDHVISNEGVRPPGR